VCAGNGGEGICYRGDLRPTAYEPAHHVGQSGIVGAARKKLAERRLLRRGKRLPRLGDAPKPGDGNERVTGSVDQLELARSLGGLAAKTALRRQEL
jgi:hypothetical protein